MPQNKYAEARFFGKYAYRIKGVRTLKCRSFGRLVLVCLAVLLLCLPTGCASFRDGRTQARALATADGFQAQRFETADYVLLGWLRPAQREGHSATVHVYIEGDGRAWLSRTQASADPTPVEPVGFELAAADPTSAPVLYLARPCQYTEGKDRRGCSREDWTSARFSPRVLRALNQAIDEAQRRTGTKYVALYGFSGGGALAALLAEERRDVLFLATVAGNLDHAAWTAHHRVSPLTDSLNPKSRASLTRGIPQLHVSGSRDAIVPPFIADSWQQLVPEAQCRLVPGAEHGGPWTEAWPRLLRDLRPDLP